MKDSWKFYGKNPEFFGRGGYMPLVGFINFRR